MTVLVVLILMVTAPVQVAITTSLVRDPLAAPVIPAALIAAWAATRRAEETWPAILVPAIILGAASEERMGWFLLALLPAPLVAATVVHRFRPRVTGLGRRLAGAALAAAAAAIAYGVILAVGGGLGPDLLAHSGALVAAAGYSAVLGVAAALCFWPLRPRERSLFG